MSIPDEAKTTPVEGISVSRRTVAKGAAWAVPAIVAAAAAPPFAASEVQKCIEVKFQIVTRIPSSASGGLRVEALCDLKEGDHFEMTIHPGTTPVGSIPHRTFSLSNPQVFLRLTTTGSHTVQTVSIAKDVKKGTVGFVNWTFAGYTEPADKPQTISVTHHRQPIGSWTNG